MRFSLSFRRFCFAFQLFWVISLCGFQHAIAENVKVIVWDEQQPQQKKAYENFLGNEIASYLAKQKGISVRSVKLDDAEQGLSESNLDNCQVLIWWGHVRHLEVKPETGKRIVQKIKDGKLSLVALHSAHWCTPFVEAMNERTRMDVRKRFKGQNVEFDFVEPKNRFSVPKKDAALTPRIYPRKFPNGKVKVTVKMPICVFPAYRPDGKPSFLKTLKPDHPLAKGIPEKFSLPGTEMYDEPFHVPAPDEVIFEERWPKGEWFRSGSVWNIGKGKVFYFRPGHETYPVYKQELALRIYENAARWLAAELPK